MGTDVLYRTRRAWGYLAVLVAAGAAARLPQLLSPSLLLDGDECIVGLMGLHVLRRHEFPVFMYGQRYGLAIVEAPLAALSFALFGAGAVPLKVAMLALWLAGAACCFRAFSRVLGDTRAFWIALLLALMPAWATGSMKAWSGYVTAFAAAGLVMDLLVGRGITIARGVAAGVVSGLVFFAQPLWLPGLLPIALYAFPAARRMRSWSTYLASAAATVAIVAAIRAAGMVGGAESWQAPAAGNPHLVASLPAVARQVYVSLTGSYFLANAIAAGPMTTAAAWLWAAVLGGAAVVQLYRLAARRFLPWSHVLFASVALTLAANWILLDARDPRYMLPLAMPLAFLAGVELFDLADRRILPARAVLAAAAVIAMLQAGAMREFAGHTFMWWTNAADAPSEARTLDRVAGAIRARGARHAYAMNPLLQWTIAFYSDEAVIARWKAARERYPPYVDEVDAALAKGEPIAIVGYTGYTYGLEQLVRDPGAIAGIDGKYFVYAGADRALLEKLGFRLTR